MVWDEVLRRIETKVNAHTFHSWFQGTRLVSDDGAKGLRVQVPNQTVVQWLNRHYLAVIGEAATVKFVAERAVPPQVVTAIVPVTDGTVAPR